jgi:hypothetical protein
MAYRHIAGKPFESLFAEDIGNETHGFFEKKLSPVRGAYPGTLLPPVLKSIKTQIREVGGLRMAVNPAYAALFVDVVEHG